MSTPFDSPHPAMLTMGQVAQRTSVSKRTVLRWIEDGILPAMRIGGVIRIDPQDLDRVIADHRMTPHVEHSGQDAAAGDA